VPHRAGLPAEPAAGERLGHEPALRVAPERGRRPRTPRVSLM